VWSSLTAVVFDDGARILDYNKCIDARSTCGCVVVVDVAQDMDAILERRPFGLRLEHTVWLAAFRDEILNLMPHPWVIEVAVPLLILIDTDRLIEIAQPADGATDDHQATRDRGIRSLPHFLGPVLRTTTQESLEACSAKINGLRSGKPGVLTKLIPRYWLPAGYIPLKSSNNGLQIFPEHGTKP